MKRQRSNSVCLEEKVAVVTGGTGVLGTAFCEGLAQEGAAVVVVGRRAEVCEELAARLEKEYGVPTLAAPADVLDQPSLFRARDKIVEKFGRIDVLVNGAGGNQKGATVAPEGSFFEVPRAAIENVFELNITGTMLATQIFGARARSRIARLRGTTAVSRRRGHGEEGRRLDHQHLVDLERVPAGGVARPGAAPSPPRSA